MRRFHRRSDEEPLQHQSPLRRSEPSDSLFGTDIQIVIDHEWDEDTGKTARKKIPAPLSFYRQQQCSADHDKEQVAGQKRIIKDFQYTKKQRPRRCCRLRERDGVDTDHKHRRNHAQNIHINLSRRLYRWESSCVISSHVTPLSAISTIM